MFRRVALVALVAALAVAGGGVARSTPSLIAGGPTAVSGTEATAVFEVGDRTVRQVRYADKGTLVYTFRLRNDGRIPVTVIGLAADQPSAHLFRLLDLGTEDGDPVRIGAHEAAAVSLRLRMGGCESLSARAGSLVTEVVLRTEQAGIFSDDVRVVLPEELHTGSPREAFCPNSTATSRPAG